MRLDDHVIGNAGDALESVDVLRKDAKQLALLVQQSRKVVRGCGLCVRV